MTHQEMMLDKIAALCDLTGKPDEPEYSTYLAGSHWKEIKQRIHEDRKICQVCLAGPEIVHHDHYRDLGNEDERDLWLLCNTCHRQIHARAKNRDALPSGKQFIHVTSKQLYDIFVELESFADCILAVGRLADYAIRYKQAAKTSMVNAAFSHIAFLCWGIDADSEELLARDRYFLYHPEEIEQ